jgi:3',5'-cyclic AMP phosphodiesterase CpdA
VRRLALLGALLGALLAACGPVAPPARFADALPPFHDGDRLIAVGDLQRTSKLEFWREQNDRERGLVVAAIAAERPALLLISGDCVFDGSLAPHWRAFDQLTAPLHAAGLPAIAALGNHEYWGGHGGAQNFFARFPLARGRWYAVDFGPLRAVVLDSNFAELSDDEWQAQLGFYRAVLRAADGDAAVKGVLVLFHHPPFTNSTVTGDEDIVQRDLLPPFLAARKTLVMHNGHVHSYERFARAGKVLVVSGGGGGPRAALDVGPHRRHGDDQFAGPALRDFNYVVYRVTGAGLAAETKGLPKGGDAFATIDRFELPWP